MKKSLVLFVSIIYFNTMLAQTIVDFKKPIKIRDWHVIDDVVMGGRSAGQFSLTNYGYAIYSGMVSLENRGGFSSLRCALPPLMVSPKDRIQIHLKGDGKQYQFLVKADQKHQHNYRLPFKTTGNWETIDLKLGDLVPSFRGKTLDIPNFSHRWITELGFLIGNKTAERFQLCIASIKVISKEDISTVPR
ncbi:MAG: CIA30 family protein [Bacteroidota bacterium]